MNIPPPPSACTNLAIRKNVKFGLKATNNEPVPNKITSMMNKSLRPYRSDILPTIGTLIASPNVYSVIVHAPHVAIRQMNKLTSSVKK